MAEAPVWLPVAQAPRRLGVSPLALRRRIRRGTIETREERAGNRVRTLVGVPAATAAAPADPEVALLRHQVAHLEGEVAWLRQRLEAELERRRWPGLKTWLKRLWAGEG